MSDLQQQLEAAKIKYQELLAQSQNPHVDPILKSLQVAIASLEKKVSPSEASH
ncbi:MAG: hypothetical protein AAF268_03490 [Cyanobacteria bacterium P01_A01_bin.3]